MSYKNAPFNKSKIRLKIKSITPDLLNVAQNSDYFFLKMILFLKFLKKKFFYIKYNKNNE